VKPGDAACVTNSLWDPSQFIYVKPGYAYEKLSLLTGGTVQSICAPSYVSQLQAIGNNIQSQAMALPFSCRPDGDVYEVTVTPEQQVVWTPDWDSMQLKSQSSLAVGTTVKLNYSCSQVN
jgi:hypothetical protein